MTAKDLSELPEELIVILAERLDYEDINACSEVNASWKQAFNTNAIWKRFCTFHSEYFFKQTSKLNHLTSDISNETCKMKQLAIKERFVRGNVLKGRYTVSNISLRMRMRIYCDTALDSVDSSGNHWLFLSCIEDSKFDNNHMIQVWNLNDDPVLYLQLETPLVKRLIYSEMKFKKGKLFHYTKEHMLIFQFDPPHYELVFLHLINLQIPSGIPLNIFTAYATICVDDVPVFLGFFYTNYHINHNLAPFFHVWDESGNLLSKNYDDALFLPNLEREVKTSSPVLKVISNGADKVFVVSQHFVTKSVNYYGLDVFDAKNQTFDKFHLEKHYVCLLDCEMINKIVGILYKKLSNGSNTVFAKCYDTAADRIIFKTEVDVKKVGLFQFIQLRGNIVLAIVDTPTGLFILFDVLNQKEVNRFTLEKNCKFLKVKSVNNYIAIVSFLKGTKLVLGVWNFVEGEKLYDLGFLSGPNFPQQYIDYHFSLIKHVSVPPKIIALSNPLYFYSKVNTQSQVAVISFW